jgi:signal transduction histidine kinase
MRRVRGVLWVAAAALGLWGEEVAFGWGDPRHWVPDLIVGWALIACGLIAWRRRPESRSGVLMALTGFTWFFGNFAGVGGLARLASRTTYVHRGPLVHLILDHPGSGSVPRRVGVAITIGYVAALIPAAWNNEVAVIVLSVLLIGAAAARYVRSVGRYRRARLVSAWAGATLGVVLAAGAAARLALPSGDVSGPALLAYQAILCAIAGVFLVNVVSASWERAAVTDLVVELGEARAGTLRGELARALGDPSLEVGFRIPDSDAFIDAEGRPVMLPEPDADRRVTVVERDGVQIAAIVHDRSVLDDPGLLDAVKSAAHLAASNARLQAEVQAQIAELEASRRRILVAGDDERRRLERRLHEGAEHRLEQLGDRLRAGHTTTSAGTDARIVRAEEQLVETLEELNRLAQGLHPRVLAEQGLEKALASLASGSSIPVELRVETIPIPEQVAAAVYFVCAEALSNVAKYAVASRATVSVVMDRGSVIANVEDDGVGGASLAKGTGLRGLADRIETLGGTLRVESANGSGTRLIAVIPLGGLTR